MSLKYWVYHSLTLTKTFYSNFGNAISNADVISAIKTPTLGTLNTDLTHNVEKTNASIEFTQIPA